MKKIQNLIFITIIISFISCGDKNNEIGLNDGSTANTVDKFYKLGLNVTTLEKIVDENDNLFVYIDKKGKHRTVGEKNFDVKRDNSLVKVSPSGELLNEYPFVVPLSNFKISVGNDKIIYMKSPIRGSSNLIKMDMNGKFITSNSIKQQTIDIATNEQGDYFVLAPTLKKYSATNKLLWETDLGKFFSRLAFSKKNQTILAVGENELINVESTSGKLLWRHSISNFKCKTDFKFCRYPIIDFDEEGNIFIAFNKKGIKSNKEVSFISISKLDKNGKEIFTKEIRSSESYVEDFFITGFSYFGGHFYMSVNSTTRKSPFNAEKAYIGKYDAGSGEEVWRQAPSFIYKKFDEFDASKYNISINPVHIKDLVQNKKTGKIWCSISFGIVNRLFRKDDPNKPIKTTLVESKFGDKSNEQTLVLNNTIYRNISSLNP